MRMKTLVCAHCELHSVASTELPYHIASIRFIVDVHDCVSFSDNHAEPVVRGHRFNQLVPYPISKPLSVPRHGVTAVTAVVAEPCVVLIARYSRVRHATAVDTGADSPPARPQSGRGADSVITPPGPVIIDNAECDLPPGPVITPPGPPQGRKVGGRLREHCRKWHDISQRIVGPA